jgi:hypothetical protein
MLTCDNLPGFLARLLGWRNDHAVDHALRSIELATAHRAHLVLRGAGDLVPIACALHRRTLGANRPFILCDPRRRNTGASVRSPANQGSGVAALVAAAGGSLCVRGSRLPHDFLYMVSRLRSTDNVQYIVCSDVDHEPDPLLVMPVPIQLPSLADRRVELPRIVDEYALDAIAALGVHNTCFTDPDRAWILEYRASSLSEIEKATMRLVALRASANVSGAAARLGMAPVSLSRWARRRTPPPMFAPHVIVWRARSR